VFTWDNLDLIEKITINDRVKNVVWNKEGTRGVFVLVCDCCYVFLITAVFKHFIYTPMSSLVAVVAKESLFVLQVNEGEMRKRIKGEDAKDQTLNSTKKKSLKKKDYVFVALFFF
jgi:hypothetical protein